MKPREIAARVLEEVSKYPCEVDYDKKTWPKTSFQFGTLRLQCLAYQEAVRAMAERYRKGFRKPAWSNKPGKHTLRRPPDADARLAALEAEFSDDTVN